jgi:uncharacterized lipoprotein YmbA
MKIASIAVLLFIVTACSSQPVDTHYYLLRADAAAHSRSLKASPDYALGVVTIASYIDQPGLVLQVSSGQIRPALHHQWAEPMHQSVRSFLQVEISTALGEDLFPVRVSPAKTVVEIRVDQLHGTDDGEATLLAYWWIQRDGKVLESRQFGKTLALKADGYEALAETEKKLLTAFAQNIAETLKAVK